MIDNIKNKASLTLSRNINGLLAKKGMKQTHLAARVKINKSTLHNYANGVVPAGIVSLKKIADFFEMSLDELIFDEKSPRIGNDSSDEEIFEIVLKRICASKRYY